MTRPSLRSKPFLSVTGFEKKERERSWLDFSSVLWREQWESRVLLGEKPGVRAVEWSESREKGSGKVEMGLQGDMVAGKEEKFGLASQRGTRAQ